MMETKARLFTPVTVLSLDNPDPTNNIYRRQY